MEYEVVIPLDTVDFTDLNDMVEQACRISGKQAHVKRQLVIVTDDLHLSMMFDSFRESLKGNGNGRKGQTAKVSRSAKAPKVQTEMGRASRRIVATDHILSLVELKKMIAAGEIDEGTVIENHRGERFVVLKGEIISEPQS